MAQFNTTTYTSTCDRCGKTATGTSGYPLSLKTLSIYADRPSEFQSNMCNHVELLQMCDECMHAAMAAIGPKAVENYKNHRETMKQYHSFR